MKKIIYRILELELGLGLVSTFIALGSCKAISYIMQIEIKVKKVTKYTIKLKSLEDYPITNATYINNLQQTVELKDNETAISYLYIKSEENRQFKVYAKLEGDFEGEVLLALGYFSDSNDCEDFDEQFGINSYHTTDNNNVYYFCPYAFKLCSTLPCEISYSFNLNANGYKRIFPLVKIYNANNNEYTFKLTVWVE